MGLSSSSCSPNGGGPQNSSLRYSFSHWLLFSTWSQTPSALWCPSVGGSLPPSISRLCLNQQHARLCLILHVDMFPHAQTRILLPFPSRCLLLLLFVQGAGHFAQLFQSLGLPWIPFEYTQECWVLRLHSRNVECMPQSLIPPPSLFSQQNTLERIEVPEKKDASWIVWFFFWWVPVLNKCFILPLFPLTD